MEQKQNDAQNTKLEDLETPVREFTEDEAAQVDGGSYVGTANGGVWKVSSGPEEPPALALKMKSTVIVSY